MFASRPVLLAAAALTLASGTAVSQEQPVPPAKVRPAFPYQPVTVVEEPTIPEVVFPGGTIQQYIDYLRSIAPNNTVNVVVTGEVGQAALPGVNLRGVTVGQAVEIIPSVIEGQRRVDIDATRNQAGTVSVYTLRYPGTGNPLTDSPSPISIFQINDLIRSEGGDGGPLASGTLPVNTILTAIESAVKMVGGPAPELKFHAESGMLLMKGSQPQMEATRDILINLRESTGRVNALGGGPMTQSFPLAHRSPEDIVQAFRDVFPAGSPQAGALKIDAVPTTNTVVVQAPRNMALAAEVLVRYVDRPAQPDPELVRLVAERDSQQAQLARAAAENQEAAKRFQDMSLQHLNEVGVLQAQTEELRRELRSVTAELDALKQKK
ncbi:MAG: hypothetical protein U0637_00890 [Phycisphaerales bacterium]